MSQQENKFGFFGGDNANEAPKSAEVSSTDDLEDHEDTLLPSERPETARVEATVEVSRSAEEAPAAQEKMLAEIDLAAPADAIADPMQAVDIMGEDMSAYSQVTPRIEDLASQMTTEDFQNGAFTGTLLDGINHQVATVLGENQEKP